MFVERLVSHPILAQGPILLFPSRLWSNIATTHPNVTLIFIIKRGPLFRALRGIGRGHSRDACVNSFGWFVGQYDSNMLQRHFTVIYVMSVNKTQPFIRAKAKAS